MPSSVDLFTTCAGVIPTVLLALVVNALGAIIQTGGPDARVRARWHRDYRVIFIVLTLNAALAEAVCLLALTAEPPPPTALRWYVACRRSSSWPRSAPHSSDE
jgi:hypothetical protein